MILFSRMLYSLAYLIYWHNKILWQALSINSFRFFRLFKPSVTKSNFEFLQTTKLVNNSKKNKVILLDEFLVPQWVLVNSILAQVLSEETEASIATFGFNRRSEFSESLFKSFSADKHFIINVKMKILVKTLQDIYILLRKVRSNTDLISYEIRNVRVGLDIYETILRTGTPTVEVGSSRYLRTVVQGVVALNFYEWIIKARGLSAVLLSHDAYIGIGLLGKVAHQQQIPVYHANPYEIIRTSGNFQIYERFRQYPNYFKSLEADKKEVLLERAKTDLKRRLKGEIGVGLSHQTISAFDGTSEYVFESTESRKALIATHCFYDNPHGYSEMIFSDFWEWLVFLGEETQNSCLEWFLKPHRDYLPGTLETLQQLVEMFPHLKILPADTSFQHLKNNNFEVAFTCYGSIGHELPNLGIAVVNCAYNPHIAYKFNTHCNTREEILQILGYLEKFNLEIELDGIYEFYAVHNYLMKPDDFFFPSMLEYQDFVKEPLSFELSNQFVFPKWKKIADRFNLIVRDYLSQTEPNSTIYLNRVGSKYHD